MIGRTARPSCQLLAVIRAAALLTVCSTCLARMQAATPVVLVVTAVPRIRWVCRAAASPAFNRSMFLHQLSWSNSSSSRCWQTGGCAAPAHLTVAPDRAELCTQHQQEGCNYGPEPGRLAADTHHRGPAGGWQQLSCINSDDRLGSCGSNSRSTSTDMPTCQSL